MTKCVILFSVKWLIYSPVTLLCYNMAFVRHFVLCEVDNLLSCNNMAFVSAKYLS